MKVALFLFLTIASSQVCAQRMDTTEVKNGRYSVFQRDALGNPKNPVAVYDTTGRLLSHVSWRDGLIHGPVIWYDSLGRKTLAVNYIKGKKHGAEVFYHPNGHVYWKLHYRKGSKHGGRNATPKIHRRKSKERVATQSCLSFTTLPSAPHPTSRRMRDGRLATY